MCNARASLQEERRGAKGNDHQKLLGDDENLAGSHAPLVGMKSSAEIHRICADGIKDESNHRAPTAQTEKAARNFRISQERSTAGQRGGNYWLP
jgi:hypothetical protein